MLSLTKLTKIAMQYESLTQTKQCTDILLLMSIKQGTY